MKTSRLQPVRRYLPAAAVLCAASVTPAQECIWIPRPNTPGINNGGPLVYHAGLQRVMLVENGYPANARLWSWEGTQWTLATGATPGPRGGFAVCYDSERDRLVLFSGFIGNTPMTDTWEWDGVAFTRVALTGPPARTGAGMVYDSARHRSVLFGGSPSGSPPYLGDTWEWDGAQWTQRATSGPPARWVSCMAYDSLRARTVLYGGYPVWLNLNDLWEWDGTAWAQRQTNPPGAYAEWMIFDPARSKMIVSIYAPSPNEGTWEFDTATGLWQLRTPGIGPYGAAAFDTARGVGLSSHYGSTMEYNGAGAVVPPAILRDPQSVATPPHALVELSVDAAGTANLYQWMRNGAPVVDDGRITGARTPVLTIRQARTTDSGSFNAVVSNACWTVESNPATLSVTISSNPCYANCDNSTTPPCLNVLDFNCFLNRFIAGDSYANCDHGYTPPVLNVLDFNCFLNRFLAGCPGSCPELARPVP